MNFSEIFKEQLKTDGGSSYLFYCVRKQGVGDVILKSRDTINFSDIQSEKYLFNQEYMGSIPIFEEIL